MANGYWDGTDEEWRRLQQPLIELDPVIDSFAQAIDVPVTKNLKDWPGRAMQWGGDIRCLIQIYLADQTDLSWNIWLCCSNDRDGSRYWKREFLVEKKPVQDFRDRLPDLLAEGHARLIEWSRHPEKLEFATKLASI